MKSDESSEGKQRGTCSMKRISKKDHALIKKLNKKSTPDGFSRPHTETNIFAKYADVENATDFFEKF